MATTFLREIRPVDISQLQNELNASVDITATVISIIVDTAVGAGDNITVVWNTDLLVDEIAAQDAIISSHIVQPNEVNIAELPFSDLGQKLGVHPSSKPEKPDKEFYLVWTGCGDDVANGLIGEGDLMAFSFNGSPIPDSLGGEIHFDPQFGDIYIHEGYMKWEGATLRGPNISAMVVAGASLLQQSINLDLVVVDNYVAYAPGGAGTGTHGFGGTPKLIPRTFAKDGDWDYDEINGLTPNMTGTGVYKISDIERIVHRYINKLPICGHGGYTRLTSDETAYLPPGYFLRIAVKNPNQEKMMCSFFFEVYRERTAVP